MRAVLLPNASRGAAFWPLALAVCCLLLPAQGAAGRDDLRIARLRPGLFLYAAPEMRDPNFAESVVLLVDHGAEGSVGLIINRPTEILARDALPEIEGVEGLTGPLFFGGPVKGGAIHGLLRASRSPGRRADEVMEGVYATSVVGHLTQALKRQDPDDSVRIFAGHAGWGPGQLQNEVRLEQWVLRPGDPDSVFTDRPARLWHGVFELRERLEVRRSERLSPRGYP